MYTEMANDAFKEGVEIYDCFDRRLYRQLEFLFGFVLILMHSHPAPNSLVGKIVTDSFGNTAIIHNVRNGGNCIILNIDKELSNKGTASL